MLHHLGTFNMNDRADRRGLLLCVLLSTLGLAGGLAAAPRNQDAENRATLPDPLHDITSNILSLEKSGLFEVMEVRIGPNRFNQKEAVIWTLRAKRSSTWRHIEIFLQRYRGAYFYQLGTKGNTRRFFKLLLYHPQITTDASGDAFLPKGGSLEVWVNLNRQERERLVRENVNKLVLKPLINR